MGHCQLSGHQGLVALYSTQLGTDLSTLDGLNLPPEPATAPTLKNSRTYFGYNFDQYLYQSKTDPKQGYGLFGQFGISEANPNVLYWSAFTGIGGTGLFGTRTRDTWGVGVYDDAFSPYLNVKNEIGSEAFYNYAVTKTFNVAADVQVINPSRGTQTAVVTGLSAEVKF